MAEGRCRTIGIRDSDGELLSAVFLVWDRHRSYYLLGGFREDEEKAKIARVATTYCLWTAMNFTRETLGLKVFDLEGSMIPGVELFFRKFGGDLTPFYVISWEREQGRMGGLLGRALGRVKYRYPNVKGNSST
jgi:hypothetical protein